MDRYLCIHGHFYQPPRENPWLEAIELQDSAFPYHDWNERITDECYRPNGHSRILSGDGLIGRIVNNYAKISFNFGPTVLAWLESKEPEVYQSILDADKLSLERFDGHGSAMAQGYNHAILPLCNDRDRRTQVIWGVRDFEHRFGRKPEGMWLPETAANVASLDALSEQGITFTILAPRQAKRMRPAGGGDWDDLPSGVDPSRAYIARLPSGRTINIFFYDGPISQGVAFEGLLNSGEAFAQRLATGFNDDRDWPQLMHIATDGETYGHHHRHGDMALAYALEYIESKGVAQLTNYADYLAKHPPQYEIEIVDDTSWSCVHGIGRWRENCGCHTGMHGSWNQEWRGPLRQALDWLRDTVIPRFESVAGAIFKDPWAARDDYITVILDRSGESVGRFLERHASRSLARDEVVRALELMELQRHSMLMYTSCGWFFDELSGIETVQVIQYAGRVIQLAEKLLDVAVEAGFTERLAQAKSNIRREGDGRSIYERYVKPTLIDLPEVGAHYAISSLFVDYPDDAEIFCYDAHRTERQLWRAGRSRLEVGRARLTSRITHESDELSYAVLHLGDHLINGGVRSFVDGEAFRSLASNAEQAFERGDVAEVLRLMNEAFGKSNYSLASLFRDEQRRVTDLVLKSSFEDVEAACERIYNDHSGLMRFLQGLNIPVPQWLLRPAEFVMTARFRDAVAANPPDMERMREIAAEAERHAIELSQVELTFNLERAISSLANDLVANPTDVEAVHRLREMIELVNELTFEIDIAEAQNRYYELWRAQRSERERQAGEGDASAAAWIEAFDRLGEALRMKIEP